jgi:hypothetical protein
VLLGATTAAVLVLEADYLMWVGVGISAFVAMQIPIAWSDCRSPAGLSEHGGGICPKCGAENRVRFWSF